MHVAGKAADGAKAVPPVARGHPGRRGRPCHGGLNGDRAGFRALEVVKEGGQQAVVALELETEPAADGQVVAGSLAELVVCS